MKKLALAGVLASLFSFSAHAVYVEKQGSCVTGNTSWNGSRKSCSGQVCYKARRNETIDEMSFKVVKVDGRGSEHNCNAPKVTKRKRKYVPGIGHVTIAREVCSTFNARSPRGHSSGRGRVECRLRGVVNEL